MNIFFITLILLDTALFQMYQRIIFCLSLLEYIVPDGMCALAFSVMDLHLWNELSVI